MLPRRDVLKLAAAETALALAAVGAHAQDKPQGDQPPPPPEPPVGFPVANVAPFQPTGPLDLARALAKAAYRPAATELPDPFNGLTFEQYVGIRYKQQARIPLGDVGEFVLEPLHRGFLFATPMLLHVVDEGMARQIGYRPDDFEFGALKPAANLPNIGFSGFRILMRRDNRLEELAIFQGASFFRSHAPGQPTGVGARALALKTADPRGEEFPIIKAVWIEKPKPGANALLIHALVDSESVAGAYRFTIRPGEATIIDTELTLVPRASVDHIGIAAMSAAVLSTPLDRRRPEDLRPTIAEVAGLQMATGKGEWIWRPVSNRTTLQLSSFVDENPKGFGFLQRNRRFEDFQDDENRWQDRPSLWIEPLSDFGPGSVALVEIPSESEANSNVIAYWRPASGITVGKEMSYAYRQFWCWEPPARSNNLIARASRAGRIGGKRRRFVVTFNGDALGDPQALPDLKAAVTVSPGALVGVRHFLYREFKTYRVVFDIEANADNFSEIRLVLESNGQPASETWLYRWTP